MLLIIKAVFPSDAMSQRTREKSTLESNTELFGCIRRIISIHNNPENLQPPKAFQQLRMTVADVHTQDITPFFNPSYDYIEEARAKNEGNNSGKNLPGNNLLLASCAA